MTNEYPIKIEHFVPLAEWLLERVAAPVGIRKLAAALPGFPARVEVPIIPSVKMRGTVLSCAAKSNLEGDDLKVPSGYVRDDIFPIFDE